MFLFTFVAVLVEDKNPYFIFLLLRTNGILAEKNPLQ